MKKLLIAVALAITSLAASAQATTVNDARYLDLSKLTDQQKADLMAKAAEMQNQQASGISEQARNEISKWSELGVGMGHAAVAAAKEVGMAANEFVSTPLGKVTMGVVVYKVIGKDVLKLAVGLSIMVFMFTVAVVMLFRKKGDVTYENIPVMNGWWVKRRVKNYSPDSDVMIEHFMVAAIATIIGLIAICNSF
jgi:hypothetical protein